MSKEDQDGSKSVKKTKIKCKAEKVSVSTHQFLSSFTLPLLDLRTNPFQEEKNDESIGDIDRVIEQIVKLMEQSKDEELGFN